MVTSEPGLDFRVLPSERLTRFEGWGMTEHSLGYAYRASSVEEVERVLRLARDGGRGLLARGSGYSYGDAALNAEQIVVDTTAMNRILAWNPASGVIQVQPGVTIGQLWRSVIEDGWWPPLVPGTMHPTLGGCLATNVHGKNNWRVGTLAEHVSQAELLLPSGEIVTVGPDSYGELFRAACGSAGILGIFLSITLQLQRITSGLVSTQQVALPSLDAFFQAFELHADSADYQVGWIDGFATGKDVGRGLLQIVDYVGDSAGANALHPGAQDLPERMYGVLPRSEVWRLMKPLVNDPGMRLLNDLQYRNGVLRSGNRRQIPLVQFHFFHDYVPNWKYSFRRGGILQYQVFVPREHAQPVFRGLLTRSKEMGFVPYLAVMKLHREDRLSLLAYNVDGYSLSLDYHETPGNRRRLRAMLKRFTDEIVNPVRGRFYLAKDAVLTREQARQSFTPERVETLVRIKGQVDPRSTLTSDLYRRLFEPRPGLS